MKLCFRIFCLLAAVVSAPSYGNAFAGTWELVSGEYLDHKGKLTQYSDLDLKSIKIIAGDHFSFVTMSGDKFWSSGAGSFRYTDQEYVERPVYTSFSSPEGQEYVFLYEIEGDTWRNARWEDGVRVEYEIWQRKD
ncbi:hypothetical protein [Biformimicrobium ophioploci]|uniref:Lipocalin-like domain-containing protein n=1 Tax=Biformimicrobium ophioploci TaxID=3036711 RepID=A0ABQ6M040_9GAMM|nr:hypothetical protein [Microbulbifer sp. NKW57]GMG87679.1 hypothetical protein MNKW57_20000 [Microbulbifer sp. NKW57]